MIRVFPCEESILSFLSSTNSGQDHKDCATILILIGVQDSRQIVLEPLIALKHRIVGWATGAMHIIAQVWHDVRVRRQGIVGDVRRQLSVVVDKILAIAVRCRWRVASRIFKEDKWIVLGSILS